MSAYGLQAWLVVLLVVTARSQAPYAIAGGIAILSVLALPQRLWTAQLKRLGLLCFFLFITTAIFAGRLSSTVVILSRMAVGSLCAWCLFLRSRLITASLAANSAWQPSEDIKQLRS